MFQVHVLKDLGVQVPRSALIDKKGSLCEPFLSVSDQTAIAKSSQYQTAIARLSTLKISSVVLHEIIEDLL